MNGPNWLLCLSASLWGYGLFDFRNVFLQNSLHDRLFIWYPKFSWFMMTSPNVTWWSTHSLGWRESSVMRMLRLEAHTHTFRWTETYILFVYWKCDKQSLVYQSSSHKVSIEKWIKSILAFWMKLRLGFGRLWVEWVSLPRKKTVTDFSCTLQRNRNQWLQVIFVSDCSVPNYKTQQ